MIRIAEMPEIIYSLDTQMPHVLGQDSLTSLLETYLRDTQTPEAFVSSRAYIVGEVMHERKWKSPSHAGWMTHNIPHEVLRPKRYILNLIRSLDLISGLLEV